MTSARLPTLREPPWRLLTADDAALAAAWPDDAWGRLDAALPALRWERQARGDVADHHLDVAMLMINGDAPRVAPGAVAAELVALLTRVPFLALLRRVGGHDRALHLRRAQANRMREGDHNRFHHDTDDDAGYTLGALLYLTDPADYDGGEIRFEGGGPLKPPRRSVIVFPASLGHELLPLGPCRRPRTSLVLLFGSDVGPRRRGDPSRGAGGPRGDPGGQPAQRAAVGAALDGVLQ
jgi:hypothetical protein